MIFNNTQGGSAAIAVIAPSGAVITASCSYVSLSGTAPCTLYPPVTGTWTVTCSYGGATCTVTQNVASYGATYSLFFGAIAVTAPDNAAITASLSGQSDVTGTGTCMLIVPAQGAWSVTSVCDGETIVKTADVSSSSVVVQISFAKPLPAITYTGDYEVLGAGDGNWRIKFKSSGTLVFTYLPVAFIDVFLVGGGGSGGASAYSGGGGSGYTLTQTQVAVAENTPYAITIGVGGQEVTRNALGNRGGTTQAFGYSAEGGYGGGYADYSTNTGGGGNGGSGGSEGEAGRYSGTGGTDGGNGSFIHRVEAFPAARRGQGQGTTTREFGEPTGDLYAGGGGGNFTPGGAGGGGSGGDSTSESNGTPGTPNTGGGGGGGGAAVGFHSGAGGSGIVVIRNSR